MFKNTIRTSAFVILTMFATNTVFSASSVRQLSVAGSAKTSSATPAITPARVSTASIIASKAKSATPMITNTTTSAKKTTAARLSTPVNVAKASDSVRLIGTPLSTGNSARNKNKPSSTTSSATLLFNTAKQAQENKDAIQEMTDNFAATNQELVEAINQKAGAESTAAEINSVRNDLTSSISSAINDVRDDMLTSNNLDYELNKSNVLLQMNDNINAKASASEVTGLTQRTVDLESAFSKDGNGDMKVKSDALPVMDMTKVNGLSDFYNAVNDEETGLAAVREKANAAKESADASVKTEELNSKIADYANDENGILVTKTRLSEALVGIPSDETVKGIQEDISKLNGTFTKDENGDFDKIKGDYLPDDIMKADKFKLRVQDGKFEYTKDNENWDKLLETAELGGTNGKSAFELWKDDNPDGTLEQFWAALKGEKGNNGCETIIGEPTDFSNENGTGFTITAKQKCDEQETTLWTKDIYNGQNGGNGSCTEGTITNIVQDADSPNILHVTYCGGNTSTIDLNVLCAEGDITRIRQAAGNPNQLLLTYCGGVEGTIEMPGGGDCEEITYSYTQPSLPVIPTPAWVPGDYAGAYRMIGQRVKTITNTCEGGTTTDTTYDGCYYYGEVEIDNTTYKAHTCTTQPVTGTATHYYLITNGLQAPTGNCRTTYTDPSEEITPSPEWVTNINDGNIGAYTVVGKTTIDCGSNNVETIDDRCVFYGWLNGDGNRASVHQCKTASTGTYYYLVTDGLPAATSIASMMDSRYPVLDNYFPGGRLDNNRAPTNMVTTDKLSTAVGNAINDLNLETTYAPISVTNTVTKLDGYFENDVLRGTVVPDLSAAKITTGTLSNDRLASSVLTSSNYNSTLDGVYAAKSTVDQLNETVNGTGCGANGKDCTTLGLAAAVEALLDGGVLHELDCNGKPTYSTTNTCPVGKGQDN